MLNGPDSSKEKLLNKSPGRTFSLVLNYSPTVLTSTPCSKPQNQVSSPKTPQSNIKRKRPAWAVFAIHPKRVWIISYSNSAQRRLIRLGGCPGWSESSLCVQVILLILSCSGSIFLWNKLLINLLHSKVTRYSVLENVLWRICIIDGRLKDWFPCGIFWSHDLRVSSFSESFQNKHICLSAFCKLFVMCPRMCR